MKKTVGLTIRLDEDLRNSFSMECKNNVLPASLFIRELIKRYVNDNAQLDIFKNKKVSEK